MWHLVQGRRMTPREIQVADRLALGCSNAEIAKFLGIAERTVKAHIGKLLRKYEVQSRTQLAMLLAKQCTEKDAQEIRDVRMRWNIGPIRNLLTDREFKIAELVARGYRNKAIALACGTTEQVVKNRLIKVYNKLGISDRLELGLMLSAEARTPVRSGEGIPEGEMVVLLLSSLRSGALREITLSYESGETLVYSAEDESTRSPETTESILAVAHIDMKKENLAAPI